MSSIKNIRSSARWAPPYLLYLGDPADDLAIKTAKGLSYWCPELCVGQYRSRNCKMTLGIPDMSMAEAKHNGADTMVIGTANAGGVMEPSMIADVISALDVGLNVASGLHEMLHEKPEIAAAAERNARTLFDVRDPPPEITVGNGRRRAGRRLLTVGTDCSSGKMFTTLALVRAMRKRGRTVDFRATGQTGILIAGSGVPVDSVVADFISGAVEFISPARLDGGWDFIEGQGSLFHPSYAGVSLGLLHGAQPDALVLCHEPTRRHIRGLPDYPIPDLKQCIEANLAAARVTNPSVKAVGVALNTYHLSKQEALSSCRQVSDQLELPCQDPVTMGVDDIVDHLLTCFEN